MGQTSYDFMHAISRTCMDAHVPNQPYLLKYNSQGNQNSNTFDEIFTFEVFTRLFSDQFKLVIGILTL